MGLLVAEQVGNLIIITNKPNVWTLSTHELEDKILGYLILISSMKISKLLSNQ
jgi:hypothetical protein